MDCSLPGSSVHGILQARILEWVACPPPGGFPNPGVETSLLHFLSCQAGSLPLAPPGKPLIRLLLGLKQCSDSSLNQISLVYIQGPFQLYQNFFSFLSPLFSPTQCHSPSIQPTCCPLLFTRPSHLHDNFLTLSSSSK